MAVKIVGNFQKVHNNLKNSFKRTLHQFCSCSTIHGLKYVYDRESHWTVRCVWLIITILMLFCGIIMIVTSYNEFRSNMTRMNIEDENAPTNQLMFPSVTVCMPKAANSWKWQQMLETLILPENLSKERAYSLINLLEYFFERKADLSALHGEEDMENLLLLNNLTFLDLVEKTRWECPEYIIKCRFGAVITDCRNIFQIAKAGVGFCCAFNIIQNGLNFTARRADATLIRGLTFALNVNSSVEAQDYEIIIGPNNAFPNRRLPLSYVSDKEISFISITPSKIISSARLKSLSIEERNCVLEDELKMEFFEKYLGNHCYMNCMVKRLNQSCGCVIYQFTTCPETLKLRICSFKDLQCIISGVKTFSADSCTCLPTCETINYRTTISSAPFYLQDSNVDEFYEGLTGKSSVVNIYISQEIYQVLLHDLLSDMLTLVSNLGSSFSLFLGMSMISVLEILYYFTIVLRKNYLEELAAQNKLLFRKTHKWKKMNNLKFREKQPVFAT